jgi:hypothetical protein
MGDATDQPGRKSFLLAAGRAPPFFAKKKFFLERKNQRTFTFW